MFKRTYGHILRELSRVSGGVDAVLEREPVLKEWQQVKAFVEAESLEAKAQDHALSGDTMSLGAAALTGSSASAGASVDCDDAATMEKLARACAGLRQAPPGARHRGRGGAGSVSIRLKKNTRGRERRSVFMTMLSADSLGESAGRAPHRRAPADRGALRKLVHGSLLGRGGRRVNPAEETSSVSPCRRRGGLARWRPPGCAVHVRRHFS